MANGQGSGLQYFPITLPGRSLIGRLSTTPGATEAIPIETLASLIIPTPATTDVNPTMFGAKGDAITLSDLNVDDGVISSPSYTFSSIDIGKVIEIVGAGSTSAVQYYGTITSVSSGIATISPAAGTPQSATEANFGTDDYAAIAAMATSVNASNAPVYWLGRSYMTANTSGLRQITFSNSYHEGAGARILLSHSNLSIDSANSIVFNAKILFINALNFDGLYISRGAPQFGGFGVEILDVDKGIVISNIRRTAADGIQFVQCGDIKFIGSVEDAGDMDYINTSPTDPQTGRQFGINCTDAYGMHDFSNAVVRRAAQSGFFFETTVASGAINVRGSLAQGCGYYNYDFERCACVMDVSGGTSIQDPTATRDYSHTFGGLLISDTAHRVCDSFSSIGSNGEDFISLSDSAGDTNLFLSADYGIIKAIGQTPGYGGLIYLDADNEGDYPKIKLQEAYCDILQLVGSSIFANSGPRILEAGCWIGNVVRSGNYTGGAASSDVSIQQFAASNYWFHIAKGDLGHVVGDNVAHASSPMMLDFGADVRWTSIDNGGTARVYLFNLSLPIGSTVEEFNSSKNCFPWDDTLNAGGVTAHYDGTADAAKLNCINTSNDCLKSIALDINRVYLVGPMMLQDQYTKCFIGAAANITTANFAIPSAVYYQRSYIICYDWLSLGSATPLALGVDTSDTTSGTTLGWCKEFPIWEGCTVGSNGLATGGPMAGDRLTRYGVLYNTIRSNNT